MTSNASRTTQIYEIYIKASPQAIWDAINESRHREQQIRSVLKRAKQLGLHVVRPERQTA